MKSEDLRDWIDSLTQDITFEYLGVNGSICPFSRSDISLCYGEKEQSFDSIDALMHAPFFKGKSLTEICSKVNLNEYHQPKGRWFFIARNGEKLSRRAERTARTN